MKSVKIRILSKEPMAFRDTTVGEVYDAILLEPGELVPDGWSRYHGQENDENLSICFMDNVNDDCAVNVVGNEDVFFTFVE